MATTEAHRHRGDRDTATSATSVNHWQRWRPWRPWRCKEGKGGDHRDTGHHWPHWPPWRPWHTTTATSATSTPVPCTYVCGPLELCPFGKAKNFPNREGDVDEKGRNVLCLFATNFLSKDVVCIAKRYMWDTMQAMPAPIQPAGVDTHTGTPAPHVLCTRIRNTDAIEHGKELSRCLSILALGLPVP